MSDLDHAELVRELIERGLPHAAGPFALAAPSPERREAVRDPLSALVGPIAVHPRTVVTSYPDRRAAEAAFERALASCRLEFTARGIAPVFPPLPPA